MMAFPGAFDTEVFEVFVGQVPVGLEKDDLYELFKGCGHIHTCFIKNCDPGARYTYGFVRFSKLESALTAVKERNGWPVGTFRLNVQLTKITCAKEKIKSLYEKMDKHSNTPIMPVAAKPEDPTWTVAEIDSLIRDRKRNDKIKDSLPAEVAILYGETMLM